MDRVTDAERLARIKRLKVSDKEALEILKSDKAIDRGEPQDFDLTPEQLKIAKKYTKAGFRKTSGEKVTRNRKPNEVKASLISELFEHLKNRSQFSIENLQIVNKERQISFSIGTDNFEITLIQKRNKKEGN